MTTALLTIIVPDNKDPATYQAVAGDHLQEKGFEVRPATPADIRERVTLEGADCVRFFKQAIKKVVEEAVQDLHARDDLTDADVYEWLLERIDATKDFDIVWSVVATLENTRRGYDPTENLKNEKITSDILGSHLADVPPVLLAWERR